MKLAFAFDIDGTLTHRHDWVSPEVVKRLHALHDAGHPIALITGRIFSFAEKVLHYFDFPYMLAVQNGADILEMPSREKLCRYYLDGTVIREIDAAYTGHDEDFVIYSGIDKGDFCYYRPERFSERMVPYIKKLESLGAAPWQASNFDLEGEAFPLVKCFGDHEAMVHVKAKLSIKPQFEISMIRDPIDPRLYLNLITHPKANKGSVVNFLRNRYPGAKVIAAGNDFNDFKMLEAADVAIAIDTAPDEVCAIGDIIAKAPEDEGIIEAIEEALDRAH